MKILFQSESGKIPSKIKAFAFLIFQKMVVLINCDREVKIITTDKNLSDEEIIRHYGNRWNIEVFFKTCKQFLKLLKESNSTPFDAFTCHLSIVAVRYMMLSVYERANSDDRTIGELFYMFAAEVAEISFQHALSLIVTALIETVRDFFHVSDEKIAEFMEMFLSRLPESIKIALQNGSTAKIAV